MFWIRETALSKCGKISKIKDNHNENNVLDGVLYCRTSYIAAVELTHLPLDKMAAICADYIFKSIFLNETFCILIKISLKLVPKGSIDNTPALVYIMAWRRLGDKPSSEPVLIQFTDAYMRH